MVTLLVPLAGVLVLIVGTVLQSVFSLFRNYLVARKIGVPVRIIPFDHVNPLWLVLDRRVLSMVKLLPFGLGNNSFTRYNYRGWEVPDRYYSHFEMGDAYILVSPRNIWLYIADPDAVMDLWRRGKEFPRDTSVTAVLDIFGPNISTAQGAQWQKHRRITASSFNDHTNQIVWSESITVANDMLRYWCSKGSVQTAADDLRTLSLHVMSRAGFGKSFKFQGHDERETSPPDGLPLNYKDSLKIILENCILIFALGRKFLANPWLPRKLRQVHAACASFQTHLTQVYNDEQASLAQGDSYDRNFINSLVRASQDQEADSTLGGGLTESEIYGNIFTFNFAGHDTTAHTFTFALYFLAANPATQDWISEEIRHVMGNRKPDEWLYSDFRRLKRCLAVIYETLRLYTPVPTSKIVDTQTPQILKVGAQSLILPPKVIIVPSYASLQTDPKYWGDDSLEWRPSRFIRSPSLGTGKGIGPLLDAEEFLTPARGTYLAWSGGARDCVGRKFSQVESVATIASLFRDWRVDPVPRKGETPDAARQRVSNQIESDSAPVLLLQMLHPEHSPLVWSQSPSSCNYNHQTPVTAMSPREQYIETAKKWFKAHSDKNAFGEDGLTALAAPGFVAHSFPSSLHAPDRNAEEYAQFQNGAFQMFSSYKTTELDIIVDETQRKVVYYLKSDGEAAGVEYKNEYIHKLTLTEDGKKVKQFDSYLDSQGMISFMGKFQAALGT
ncbi:hypothetical protein JX266_009118 [Neoarthrinium moseri]|nr:hypothetical protein JX266_009118 [Neoarthrinium moseri]